MSNKRKVLSVIEKVAIIKDSESGVKNSAICKKYGLSSSTVSTLLKNRKPLLHAYERNITASKRLKKYDKADLDEVLYRWYIFQKNSGLPTNCMTMRDQAQIFAFQLGYEDFSCTNGWLHRFRMRHNILPLKKNGETVAESVPVPSICSDGIQSFPNLEIVKKEESDSETSLTSNYSRKCRLCPEKANMSVLNVNNDLNTNKINSVETSENKEVENTLSVSASTISVNNLQKPYSIDHNNKGIGEIKEGISETLNNSLPSFSQDKGIVPVECHIETEMLDMQQENEAGNNYIARTQLLPKHFYDMATHCVQTLQCFFESIDQKDNEVFDALAVIRHKLSNVNPNETTLDKR